MSSPPPPPPQWQLALAGWVPMISGNLSIAGSSLIIYSILCFQRKQKLAKPHMRLLLAMSFWDIFSSFVEGWSFLFAPSQYGFPGSIGNMVTCRMQGFLAQMTYSTAAYNAVLSTYYWLTVSRGVKAEQWLPWERFFHVAIPLLNITLGSIGVATGLYQPSFAFCFIAAYPPGCETYEGAPPCQYYSQAQIPVMFQLFTNMWVQFYILVVFATCFAIWWKVRQQENAMKRYGANNHEDNKRRRKSRISVSMSVLRSITRRDSEMSTGGGGDRSDSDFSRKSTMENNRRKKEARQVKRNHQVFVQCALYSGSFLLCWSGPILFGLLAWIKGIQSFAFVMLIVIFVPLQGFFNCIVFARPTYLRVRRKYPYVTRWDAFFRVFFAEDPMKPLCSSDGRRTVARKDKFNLTKTTAVLSNFTATENSNLHTEVIQEVEPHHQQRQGTNEDDDDDDDFDYSDFDDSDDSSSNDNDENDVEANRRSSKKPSPKRHAVIAAISASMTAGTAAAAGDAAATATTGASAGDGGGGGNEESSSAVPPSATTAMPAANTTAAAATTTTNGSIASTDTNNQQEENYDDEHLSEIEAYVESLRPQATTDPPGWTTNSTYGADD